MPESKIESYEATGKFAYVISVMSKEETSLTNRLLTLKAEQERNVSGGSLFPYACIRYMHLTPYKRRNDL